MRVGAHDGVRIGLGRRAFLRKHHAAQELQVHLVDDAGVGRHDLEVAEGALAPAQEGIAFAVTLELDAVVVGQRVLGAVLVHLHRVVDHKLCWRQRIHLLRVAAKPGNGLAHGGKIHHAGHAGEVLHDHAGRREGDFVVRRGGGIPAQQGLDVLVRHVDAVFKAQQVLQQDLERVGQARDLVLRQPCETPDRVLLAVHVECGTGLEAVGHAILHASRRAIIYRFARSLRRQDSVSPDISLPTGRE